MGNEPQRLPDYDDPPVVETVLGVQFDRLAGFRNAHLGAFWNTLDSDEWPTVADANLLHPQFEEFAETGRWAKGAFIQLSQDPAARVQIKSRDGDRMIQVQNDRLHFNWIGAKDDHTYPRYDNVRDGFTFVLDQFLSFIDRANIGDFRANQWEVTYVNHLPRGTVWNEPSDWNFFKPLGPVPTIENLIQGESFGGEWHFVIPEKVGRLHINWRHSKKLVPDEEEEEFIRLTFTARGPVENTDDPILAIFAGLDVGHRTSVLVFKELMDDNANKSWGMKHDADNV